MTGHEDAPGTARSRVRPFVSGPPGRFSNLVKMRKLSNSTVGCKNLKTSQPHRRKASNG